VREITGKWLSEYNSERPYESLNNMTPKEYRQHHYLAGISKMLGTKTGLFTATGVCAATAPVCIGVAALIGGILLL